MSYWLHRISHHAETSWPLLERGYLTIGFSDLSSPEFLNRVLTAIKVSDLDGDIQRAYGRLLKQRYNLWRFLREMCTGDIVLVPGWGTYSVYVIEGDPEPVGNIDLPADLSTDWDETVEKYDYGEIGKNEKIHALRAGPDKRHIDLGFFRRVKLHRIGGENGPEAKEISRYDYADNSLVKRMKFLGTNVSMSDLEDNIKRSLEAYGRGTPPNLHAQIMEEMAAKLLKLIHEELAPDKFESLIEWYFKKVGASEVDIPSKNESDKEGDADIIATFETIQSACLCSGEASQPR